MVDRPQRHAAVQSIQQTKDALTNPDWSKQQIVTPERIEEVPPPAKRAKITKAPTKIKNAPSQPEQTVPDIAKLHPDTPEMRKIFDTRVKRPRITSADLEAGNERGLGPLRAGESWVQHEGQWHKEAITVSFISGVLLLDPSSRDYYEHSRRLRGEQWIMQRGELVESSDLAQQEDAEMKDIEEDIMEGCDDGQTEAEDRSGDHWENQVHVQEGEDDKADDIEIAKDSKAEDIKIVDAVGAAGEFDMAPNEMVTEAAQQQSEQDSPPPVGNNVGDDKDAEQFQEDESGMNAAATSAVELNQAADQEEEVSSDEDPALSAWDNNSSMSHAERNARLRRKRSRLFNRL